MALIQPHATVNNPILLFGGGNMGGALARHWHAEGIGAVHVIERDPARRSQLNASGIRTYANLAEAPIKKSILILAIKPQQFANMDADTSALIAQAGVVVSIMAGVPLASLQKLHKQSVRVMPNLPAGIGAGMSAAYAPELEEARRRAVNNLFNATGKFLWVEREEQLHAVTAISGSGPAYVFAFLEAFIAAAVARGFSEKDARLLATQTLLGAASQASQTEQTATQLRVAVTSPAGTTEAALKIIGTQFGPILDEATKAAEMRSKELANG